MRSAFYNLINFINNTRLSVKIQEPHEMLFIKALYSKYYFKFSNKK